MVPHLGGAGSLAYQWGPYIRREITKTTPNHQLYIIKPQKFTSIPILTDISSWDSKRMAKAVFAPLRLEVVAKTVKAAAFGVRCNYADAKERR